MENKQDSLVNNTKRNVSDPENAEEMKIVPAQDSPKHILIALNNDCIQEVFRRVTNLKDFLSVALVCKRFAENASACIQAKHRKQLCIGNNYRGDSFFRYDEALRSRLLPKFGHLVESIVWRGTLHDHVHIAKFWKGDHYDYDMTSDERLRKRDDDLIFKAIVEYCGTNIKAFDCIDVRSDGFSVVNGSSFGSLEEIRLSMCPSDMVWLLTKFPKLKNIRFNRISVDDKLIKFLEYNPQIRSLELFYCCPSRSNAIKMSGLQNLTSLHITLDDKMLLLELLDIFAINNVPLKHLTINSDTGDEFSDCLSSLKLLKSLNLMKMSDTMLVQLTENLPVLESINIRQAISITVDSIKEALQCGRCLKFIQLCGMDVALDLDGYNSVMAIARGRVQIKMWTHGVITVPKEMLEANRKWIDIALVDLA